MCLLSPSVCHNPGTLVSVLSSSAHLGAQKIGQELENLVKAHCILVEPYGAVWGAIYIYIGCMLISLRMWIWQS